MQIAIIDDNEVLLAELGAFMRYCLRERELEADIALYTSGEQFIADSKNRVPDLALVDLVLDRMDGFSLAECLRQKSILTEIAFVTSYDDRMHEAFSFKPLAYLVKPVSMRAMADLLERFLRYYRHAQKQYAVSIKGETRYIAHADIQYFESDAHRVLIHTQEEQPAAFTARLDDVARELADMPYVRCHKSYLVNMESIAQISRTARCFVLKSGRKVPVSKALYTDAVNAFTQYKLD